MIKKLFLFFSILITLTSCANNIMPTSQTLETPVPTPTPTEITKKTGDYIDGIYSAYEEEYNEVSGYKDQIIITIENNQITHVDFNGFDQNNRNKKTESHPGGSYNMKTAGAQKDWYEQAELLEQYLIDTQHMNSIRLDENSYTDTIAGVSIKVDNFTSLSNEALSDAAKK